MSGSKNVEFDDSNSGTAGMLLVSDAGSDGSNIIGAGYAKGWGGTATQLTDKETDVTFNFPGYADISTANETMTAGDIKRFKVLNTFSKESDQIVVTCSNGNYIVWASDPQDGHFYINLERKVGGPGGDVVVIRATRSNTSG